MDPASYTTIENIHKAHAIVNETFHSGRTLPIAFRQKLLASLVYMLKDNTDALCAALQADLHRHALETILSDIGIIISETVNAYNHVQAWAKDIKPPTLLTYQTMNLRIKPSPKGAVLIISPFNYPIFLTLLPVVAALSAGCTVVLKLPESMATSSPLLADLIAKYVDPGVVQVVQGAAKEASKLLDLKWDHIFFTGSERIGRIVATAAAKHTTPVTLELGGKCPVIIDPRGADFSLIGRRILWGKTCNGGQACVAPDYVLVPRSSQDALIAGLQKAYKELFPTSATTSDSYARIVTQGATSRIKGYLDNTKGDIVIGGQVDTQTRFIEPTVVSNVGAGDSTMQDEIFGALLSLVPVDTLEDAIKFVSERPQPLALYVFSQNSEFKKQVTDRTRSGSIVFNDVLIQVGAPGLPFGGSGSSGYGSQKGKFGFDTFTHMRASMDVPGWIERFMAFRYPPYTKRKQAIALKTVNIALPFDRDGKRLFNFTRWFTVSFIVLLMAVAYRIKYTGWA